MKELFKKYPALSLGIFALVTLAVAYWLGSRTGRGVSLSAAKNQLDNEIRKTPLTYDLSQYSVLADRLESAMFRINDDEETIYSVFSKLRNKSDVLQLIKAFGSRRLLFHIGTADLTAWLSDKLTKSEIQNINDILSRNNIDFNF